MPVAFQWLIITRTNYNYKTTFRITYTDEMNYNIDVKLYCRKVENRYRNVNPNIRLKENLKTVIGDISSLVLLKVGT